MARKRDVRAKYALWLVGGGKRGWAVAGGNDEILYDSAYAREDQTFPVRVIHSFFAHTNIYRRFQLE